MNRLPPKQAQAELEATLGAARDQSSVLRAEHAAALQRAHESLGAEREAALEAVREAARKQNVALQERLEREACEKQDALARLAQETKAGSLVRLFARSECGLLLRTRGVFSCLPCQLGACGGATNGLIRAACVRACAFCSAHASLT
jgi:hypothetical protein